MARQPVPRTVLDRAIEIVAPSWALRRYRDRAALALAGGYVGGSRSRPSLAGWNPLAGDADADTAPDLPMLRARCRDLGRNHPLTAGALNTVCTNVVGTGLSMRPAIDADALGLSKEAADAWQAAVRREWALWAETTECDVTRTQNIYGLQALAFRSAMESGDVFAVLPDMKDSRRRYRLAVQLIEADRVCNPGFGADTARMVAGVESDEWGAPVRYHVSRSHPGAMMRKAGMQWDAVPAFGARTNRRNVLHLFDRLRPGQSRGVPYFAPVMESLKQLGRYTDAEIQAAVVSAAFAVFVKMDPEAFQSLFDGSAQTTYLNAATGWNGSITEAGMDTPGKAINLLPGEEIMAPDLKRPNVAFDPFVLAVLRQIGTALELPFEVLTKHFTSSYSAARAALLDAWKFFRRRRDWLTTTLCQPIYEAWLDEAVAAGRIAAPGYFADAAIRAAWCRAAWVGDGPGSIDPAKEVKAAADRVALGISTREEESILHDGRDWSEKHRQLVTEEDARRRDGLGAVAAPAAPAPEPEDDPEDDTEDDNDDEMTAPPARSAIVGDPQRLELHVHQHPAPKGPTKMVFARRPDGGLEVVADDEQEAG